jgi:hypothetical protein
VKGWTNVKSLILCRALLIPGILARVFLLGRGLFLLDFFQPFVLLLSLVIPAMIMVPILTFGV